MRDLFHEARLDDCTVDVFDVIARADWRVFQITELEDRLAGVAVPSGSILMSGSASRSRAGASFTAPTACARSRGGAVHLRGDEPLLGPLDGLELDGIDWLIAGASPGSGTVPSAWGGSGSLAGWAWDEMPVSRDPVPA
jgi:protein gp37